MTDIWQIGAVLAEHFKAGDCGLVFRVGELAARVEPDETAYPLGGLPVLLIAADALWRRRHRRSFGLTVSDEPAALFGYWVGSVSSGPRSAILLAVLEVADRFATSDGIDGDALLREVQAWRAVP